MIVWAWENPGSFLNLVVLHGWITGGVIEGFSRASVVGDAAVNRGVLWALLLAAIHQSFVSLTLTPAEVGFVASEALEFHGTGL